MLVKVVVLSESRCDAPNGDRVERRFKKCKHETSKVAKIRVLRKVNLRKVNMAIADCCRLFAVLAELTIANRVDDYRRIYLLS